MSAQRIDLIRAALEQALAPASLVIEDQSAAHAGHAGAASGRGHFAIDIVAEAFAGLSPLACHRLVYAALGTLMDSDIHALSIRASSPT